MFEDLKQRIKDNLQVLKYPFGDIDTSIFSDENM